MAGRYYLRNSVGQYYFVLKAGNGEVLLTSERYTTKASALNGIQAVRANAPSDAQYVRLTSRDAKPYFVLRAANAEVLGTSETYSSAAARETGIASTKANAPVAPVSDET